MLHSYRQRIVTAAILLSMFHGRPSRAQDYPYDETESKHEENTGLPRERRETIEEAYNGRYTRTKRIPTLFRLGIKGGVNFSYFEYPSATGVSPTTQITGMGFDGLLALGWDLPYQPIFLEFETGYRALFFNTDYPLHVIPVAFGIFYRQRIAARSLWKPGIQGSLDVRIAQNDSRDSAFGIFPAISISSGLEFGSLLFEPRFTISRIQSQNLFFTLAFRSGFRF